MSKRGRPNRHERRRARRRRIKHHAKRRWTDPGEQAGYEGEDKLEEALKLVIQNGGPPFATYHRSRRLAENDMMGVDAWLFLGKRRGEKRARMHGDGLAIPLQIKNSLADKQRNPHTKKRYSASLKRHYARYPYIYAMDARKYKDAQALATHIINLTRRLLYHERVPMP